MGEDGRAIRAVPLPNLDREQCVAGGRQECLRPDERVVVVMSWVPVRAVFQRQVLKLVTAVEFNGAGDPVAPVMS